MGGHPKQLRPLGGVPVVRRAVAPFLDHPEVVEVIVVLPADALVPPPGWLAEAGPQVRAVAGGAERTDSVDAGLRALGPAAATVLVHDGARPFPDRAVIDRIIAIARAGRGAVAALPVTDTIKAAAIDPATGEVVVQRTVPRDELWRAQTPQGFPRDVLARALARARGAGAAPTDDAAAVEALGVPIVLVPDVARNLKITTPADFAVAEALLEAGA